MGPSRNTHCRTDVRSHAARDGRPEIRVPTADDRIEEGDRLVVAGTKSAVDSLDAI